tara:strand:+ start:147 stop:314 length:168 start_codon:yes stop_codon:yes gene_type:complete
MNKARKRNVSCFFCKDLIIVVINSKKNEKARDPVKIFNEILVVIKTRMEERKTIM